MRMRILQSFILTVAIFAGAGCDNSPPSDSNLVSATVDPCSPPLQPSMIFYDEKGEPSDHTPALSELEIRRVMARVAEETNDPIWFIRVKPGLPIGERGRVIVYLVPEEQNPRIRMGHMYALLDEGEEMSIAGLSEYLQISKPDETFDEELRLPSASDLPFIRSKPVDADGGTSSPLSEEELIRIADFVRELSNYESPLSQRLPPLEKVAREIRETPILTISQERRGIRVDFGYLHGGTFGHGLCVILEATPDGYKMKSWSYWVS